LLEGGSGDECASRVARLAMNVVGNAIVGVPVVVAFVRRVEIRDPGRLSN